MILLVKRALTFATEALDIGYRAWRTSQATNAALVSDVAFCPWRLGGVSDPVPVTAGPSQGWQFAVGNELYAECPLRSSVDRTAALVFGIAWAPIGNEAAKRVTWQLDFGFEYVGKNLADTDYTDTTDVAVPATAGDYVHSSIIVVAATWAIDPAVDEVHVKLTRNANANDPVTDPAVHHFAFIQQLSL